MADGFRAETTRLITEAGRFDGLVTRVEAIHRDLADQLAAAGECWGTDEVGQSFAATHVPSAEEVLGALGGLPGKLGAVGGHFGDTARTYRAGDGDNARTINASDD